MGREGQVEGNAEIPYERASGSGLQNFIKELESVPEATTETQPENLQRLKLASRQCWYLSRQLKNYTLDKSLKGGEKELAEQTSSLAYNYADYLTTSLHVIDELSHKTLTEKDREVRQFVVADINRQLKEWQTKFEALPIESRFSSRRIKVIVKRFAAVAALLTVSGLGTELWQSVQKQGQKQEQKASPKKNQEKNYPPIHRERHSATPDMEDDGKEPGRHGKALPFAKIHFSYFNNLSDPLWTTNTYRRADAGTMETDREIIRHDGWWSHAEVTTVPLLVFENEEISLPTPVGYAAELDSVSKNAPEYFFDSGSQAIIFKKNAADVVIKYHVVKINEEFEDTQPNQKEINRSADQAEVIYNLKNAPLEKQKQVLTEHLKKFTYVTSSQLGIMLSKMPGNLEEKIGAIKVGDCDMLSLYAAGLLNDSGNKGLIAVGLPERNGVLNQNPAHAKLIMFNKNSDPETFETTALPEKSFLNLKFLPEDYVLLNGLVQNMSGTKGPELLSHYETFRLALEKILENPEYAKFGSTEGMDFSKEQREKLEMTSKLVKNMADKLSEIDPDAESLAAFSAAFILLLLGLIGGIAGTLVAINRLSVMLAKKVSNKHSEETVKALKDFLGETPNLEQAESSEHNKQLSTIIERAYKERPDMEKLFPLKEIMLLSASQKADYIRFMRISEYFLDEDPTDVSTLIFSLLAEKRWNKAMAEAEMEGLNLRETVKKLGEVLASNKMRESFKKSITAQVKAVMDESRRMFLEKIERLDKIGQASLDNIFRVLEVGEKMGLNSHSTSRQPRPEAGADFIDYAPYQEGMDSKAIDWRVYGRTDKLYVKRTADSVASREKNSLNLLIDVTAWQYELAPLATLLLYGQKHKGSFNLSSITFTCEGEVIGHMPGKDANKLLSEGRASVEKFMEHILNLKLKYGVEDFKSRIYNGRPSLRSNIPLKDLGQNEKFLVVGIAEMEESLIRHKATMFHFKPVKTPDEEMVPQ